MHHNMIGCSGELQGASGMPLLPSRGAATFAAQGLGIRFLEAVGGGGLAGVVAVLAETVFELFDAQAEETHSVLEGVNHLYNGVGSQIIEGLDLFAREHSVPTSNTNQRFRIKPQDFAGIRPEQLQLFLYYTPFPALFRRPFRTHETLCRL